MARLGVNIDHVATLRQARGEVYPSLVDAAKVSLEAGADQITIHLREDRRHIQDADVAEVYEVTKSLGRPLNLELATAQEILDIAANVKPEWICIVPEKREEKTTEGGLNLMNETHFSKVKESIEFLRKNTPDSKISLFVESNIEVLKKCIELGCEAVEIHTGEYAIDFNKGRDISSHLNSYIESYEFLESEAPQIGFHAGHGLTDKSTIPLVEQGLFAEYNIGHWIISQSVFDGLSSVVSKLAKLV